MHCLMEKFPCLNRLSREDCILDVLISFREQKGYDEWSKYMEEYEWLKEWHVRVGCVDVCVDHNGNERISCKYYLAPKHPYVLWLMVIHNAQLMEGVYGIYRREKIGKRINLTRDVVQRSWYKCARLYSQYGICEFYRGKYYRFTRAFKEFLIKHGITLPDMTA